MGGDTGSGISCRFCCSPGPGHGGGGGDDDDDGDGGGGPARGEALRGMEKIASFLFLVWCLFPLL